MDPLPRRTALNIQSVQTSGDPTGQRHSVQRSHMPLHRAVFTVQSSHTRWSFGVSAFALIPMTP
eukprot:1468109-Prymnesium_polylepis.1